MNDLPTDLLHPGEELRATARAQDAYIAATSRRLIVIANESLAIDVPYKDLRRVQFDLERKRPATFVIVPDSPAHPARVLDIPWDEVPNVAQVLATMSEAFAPLDE